MGQEDGRCDHVYPEGHDRAGERCGSRILPRGEDNCRLHTEKGLAEFAEERMLARLEKVSNKEIRKPPSRFFREGWDQRPLRPARQCADAFGVDMTTVGRWYQWVERRDLAEKVSESWSAPERHFPTDLHELTAEHVPAMVADFLGFRGAYFKTRRGRAYVTPGFQQTWIYKVFEALATGGRLLILSPPRHGKTELLIHISLWLICRFPNICIIWVGGNEDLAKQALGSVMDHLEVNEDLIRDFCPPGSQFKPSRFEGKWSASAFEVATRTVAGIKQPTMKAVGRGGRLRSQDTDFIICDDVDDEKSTVQASTREETRRWWTTGPDSRKEEHTALFYIGSRAHPEDLAAHLLENDEYEVVVERAHDPECDLPRGPDNYEIHVDCMLFPELRSYRWLMQQQASSQTVGGAQIFEMLYQNVSSASGFMTFTAEIVDPCRDPTVRIGEVPAPIEIRDEPTGNVRLVAGLDPAGSGYQAAFLWAFQIQPRLAMWMVDLENHEGGGIAEARRIIRAWWEKYRLSHWVIEENLYQGGIVDDDQITQMSSAHGITLESFRTYRNKVDPRLGVTALAPLFADRTIRLPYADAESQQATDAYRRQLLHYDGTAARNRNTKAGYKSDIVMASWFPLDVIRRAQEEAAADMGVDYSPAYSTFGGSQWNTAPWQRAG